MYLAGWRNYVSEKAGNIVRESGIGREFKTLWSAGTGWQEDSSQVFQGQLRGTLGTRVVARKVAMNLCGGNVSNFGCKGGDQ
jgi:hypothetical protein